MPIPKARMAPIAESRSARACAEGGDQHGDHQGAGQRPGDGVVRDEQARVGAGEGQLAPITTLIPGIAPSRHCLVHPSPFGKETFRPNERVSRQPRGLTPGRA